MKKLIFYLVILLSSITVFSQVINDPAEYKTSPNGYFDDVFDHYGNKYKLEDLKVYERSNGQYLSRNPMLCNSGIFELYFETGSGMEGSSSAEIARRAVVCQVFQDLSNFINSPLKDPGNSTKVKIWVRDIDTFDDVPSGTLGMASSFYNTAFKADTNFGGIADNEIWKTITLGTDSYISVAAPIVSGNEVVSSGIFYHGMMALNFDSIVWNTNLGISAPSGQYDLYTVVLHEVAHALGIASLIDENGKSVFGQGYNYFSRYDRFLKDNAGTKFLINNTGSCSMYNYKFNTNLSTSVLHPSTGCVTDQTTCSSAIKYVGSNTIPVYTPNCFEEGSSLSHFEDQCVAPNVNNAYFALSNANGAGVTKRFLKPEERLALCDIGYSVNNTFSSSGQLSYKYYGGSVCTGIQVAGTNDGMNNDGTFSFIGNSGANILISGILNNDFTTNLGDLRFECLQDVNDASANFSATGGDSTTTITYSSVMPGIHLLRYIPYNNTTGQRGNITYIYVYVKNVNNCAIPDACNLVMNGDFEQYSSLPTAFEQLNKACGWNSANSVSPTYFHMDSTYGNLGVPCNCYGNESDNVIGNKGYAAFSMVQYPTYIDARSMYTTLTTPLLPDTTYQISFDISLGERGSMFYMKPQIYFSTTNFITAGYGTILIPNPDMLFETSSYPTTTNGWERIKITIKTGPVAGEKYLYLGVLNNPDISEYFLPTSDSCPHSCGSAHTIKYYLDNIELVQLNGAELNIPEEHCQNVVLSNLNSYVVAAPSNGVFSGPGVSVSGGVYSFSASLAGLGTHTIVYSYTNTSGCIVSIYSDVTVLDCTEEPTEPCPTALIFTVQEPAFNATYEAGQIITHTKYNIENWSNIVFKAQEAIIMGPESIANTGSNFLAYIGDCTESFSSRMMSTVEENSRLDVYPNPTKGFVTISARDLKISKVMVTSLEGKIIHTRNNINNYSYDLTLENFQTGIYSVIVETVDGEVIVDKIIKN